MNKTDGLTMNIYTLLTLPVSWRVQAFRISQTSKGQIIIYLHTTMYLLHGGDFASLSYRHSPEIHPCSKVDTLEVLSGAI